MTKYLTLLVHRIFPIFLFIGLAWGQSDLSIKEKAVLDAEGDAKKWLAYPPLALISAGGVATATFYIGEDIYDGDILLPLIIVGGSLGVVGSYYLFNKLDKKSIEAISPENNKDYKNIYSQEFKKRKSENIISSGVLVSLATCLTALLIIESFSGGMGNYDACFDPRCD